MLWDLLKHSKKILRVFADIPDVELPFVGIFTLARLCTALAILPKAVSALLKTVVGHGPAPESLSVSQTVEAQTIINEADYPTLAAEVLKKFDIMVGDLTSLERETHVVGSLCSKTRMLAHYYAPRIKGILGVDLVGFTTVAPTTLGATIAGSHNESTGHLGGWCQ